MQKQTFLVLILVFCPLLPVLQAQGEEVAIEVDTLSRQVYMLTGRGGNIGLYIGKSEVYMIDDQFDHLSEKIKAAIRRLTDKPIRFLINTHMHGDHTGGNANFNNDTTTIVAHDNVRKRIIDRQQKPLAEKKISLETYTRMLPELTFSEQLHFYEGDETILIFHVHNAHTDGDTMTYFVKNNVLHMGDTYFAGRYPYIDLDSGGSIAGYIQAQKKALMLIDEDTKIIPGHGRPSNKKELEAYILMLEAISGKVRAAIAEGRSLEEVRADPEIAASYDGTHGTGYIDPKRMREIFYKSLKEN